MVQFQASIQTKELLSKARLLDVQVDDIILPHLACCIFGVLHACPIKSYSAPLRSIPPTLRGRRRSVAPVEAKRRRPARSRLARAGSSSKPITRRVDIASKRRDGGGKAAVVPDVRAPKPSASGMSVERRIDKWIQNEKWRPVGGLQQAPRTAPACRRWGLGTARRGTGEVSSLA